jgi:hypothetical protein
MIFLTPRSELDLYPWKITATPTSVYHPKYIDIRDEAPALFAFANPKDDSEKDMWKENEKNPYLTFPSKFSDLSEIQTKWRVNASISFTSLPFIPRVTPRAKRKRYRISQNKCIMNWSPEQFTMMDEMVGDKVFSMIGQTAPGLMFINLMPYVDFVFSFELLLNSPLTEWIHVHYGDPPTMKVLPDLKKVNIEQSGVKLFCRFKERGETRIGVPPIPNIYRDGAICTGQMPTPMMLLQYSNSIIGGLSNWLSAFFSQKVNADLATGYTSEFFENLIETGTQTLTLPNKEEIKKFARASDNGLFYTASDMPAEPEGMETL